MASRVVHRREASRPRAAGLRVLRWEHRLEAGGTARAQAGSRWYGKSTGWKPVVRQEQRLEAGATARAEAGSRCYGKSTGWKPPAQGRRDFVCYAGGRQFPAKCRRGGSGALTHLVKAL